MSTRWYERSVLLDRGIVAEAIAVNGGNRSAAAADLGCTAAQLKKAAEVYCIVSVKELEEGTAAELRLRRMLFSGMLIGGVPAGEVPSWEAPSGEALSGEAPSGKGASDDPEN